jgi:arylsulfatase A
MGQGREMRRQESLVMKHLIPIISALCAVVTAQPIVAAAPPNVVYIIPDDHTFRDFGFMGSPDALTPHMDRLAAQSARFVNGYVPTSLCSPSLAVMLTGRYPHQS